MNYVAPKSDDKSLTVNGVEYTTKYYEAPITMTGVDDTITDDSGAVAVEYDNTATYNVGDYVLLDALKKYYRCAADATSGSHPLEYPDLWVDFGPINSYRMLASDEFINNKTTSTVPTATEVSAVIVVDSGRKDTFAFVDADFISVNIKVVNNDGGEVVFDIDYDGRDYGALTYSEFYYTDYKTLSRLVVDGIEWLPDATLTLTFKGSVSIGGLVSGNSSPLGVALYGTSLKFEDSSKVSVSPITGTRSVLRYGNVRVVDVKVVMDTDEFNIVANKIDAIIGHNILWIPDSLDKFAELISIGYIEDITLPIDNPQKMETQATIIGVL